MMESVTFEPSRLQTIRRLFVWLRAFLPYFLGNLGDWLTNQRSEDRRAERLRRTFAKVGGTFPKIGQQLSKRVDILPWAYCMELSKLLDQMPPFNIEHAIAAVEKATGKPLAQTFRQFDPEPIGSASIACIYQAYLTDGKKVAVKVLRPGIGEVFMADITVLGWLLKIVEFLSFVRPDFAKILLKEFRDTFLEELNLTLAARYQTLFRSAAKKSGKKFFTAPKIYYEFCSQDVLVQDFVSGIWLWELIAAVEQKDEKLLTYIRSLDIDPKKVAKRLLWVNFWGMDEYFFFHADPHPANIVVQANNKLAFIDFGSVGAMDREKLRGTQELMLRSVQRDPLGMARAMIGLLEPIPPIDINSFTKEIENRNWQYLYGLESKHNEWWERTSASLWFGFIGAVQKYQLTINSQMLQMMRASFQYDTAAALLYSKIDRLEEYHKFHKYRAKKARKRAEKKAWKRRTQGVDNFAYLRLEEVGYAADRLLFQLHRFLDKPAFRLNISVGKSVYTLSILIGLISRLIVVTGITAVFAYGITWIYNNPLPSVGDLLKQIVTNRQYKNNFLFLIFINVRRNQFRYGYKGA
jgi:predicted unusual protein kinase regulating ubiquinone biosynthesis (AarF/ABC1/UbiB family)